VDAVLREYQSDQTPETPCAAYNKGSAHADGHEGSVERRARLVLRTRMLGHMEMDQPAQRHGGLRVNGTPSTIW